MNAEAVSGLISSALAIGLMWWVWSIYQRQLKAGNKKHARFEKAFFFALGISYLLEPFWNALDTPDVFDWHVIGMNAVVIVGLTTGFYLIFKQREEEELRKAIGNRDLQMNTRIEGEVRDGFQIIAIDHTLQFSGDDNTLSTGGGWVVRDAETHEFISHSRVSEDDALSQARAIRGVTKVDTAL